MSFFDHKTRRLISKQGRILKITFAFYCILGAEVEIITSLWISPNSVGWETMQIFAVGIWIILLDPTIAIFNPEVSNEKDPSNSH